MHHIGLKRSLIGIAMVVLIGGWFSSRPQRQDDLLGDLIVALRFHHAFVPADSLVADICALTERIGEIDRPTLEIRLQDIRLADCAPTASSPREKNVVRFSGEMTWEGGRTRAFAVHVMSEYGTRIHDELITVRDGSVVEIKLTGLGFIN